jgi:hypothetical protein
MSLNILPSFLTIEIGGVPTLVFEAMNLREAHELCREQRLKTDLMGAISNASPSWDGHAKLRARIALFDEAAKFAEAKRSGRPSDGLMLVYLVELDGDVTTEEETADR